MQIILKRIGGLICCRLLHYIVMRAEEKLLDNDKKMAYYFHNKEDGYAMRNKIKSLERGLNILQVIAKSARPLTLTEVATSTNLTKTTAYRFLNTLRSLGYLNQEEGKRYSLGTKILSLGFTFLNSSNLRTMVKPYLNELSTELDKTVNLAILDDLDILFLYRKEVRKFLKHDLQAGSKLPAYCTASGKILLAGLSDEELKKRISEMEFYQISPKTITSREILWEDIMETRKRGYSICGQELSMDLYSLAVPLLNEQGKIDAAFNVSLETKDIERIDIKAIIAKMLEKGEMISRILGYKGPYPRFIN
ncbi:MAG: IclR family transcriptional regulator [Deltaproteobacteria bacterium]|nr:IclR family transcriptional regulator [Deltaproteobacteria bacterium]